MKKDWSAIEKNRRCVGIYQSSPGDTFGMFIFATGNKNIRVIAVDGQETGWEHVSVSIAVRQNDGTGKTRMPTWEEMCEVKALFWEPDECVVQFHPPESEYVNIHQHVLHLWRCVNAEFPMPPKICV